MIKEMIQSALSKLGLHLIKTKKGQPKTPFNYDGFVYDSIAPDANYAPWLNDTGFHGIYNEIKGNSLVDTYRIFELWELAGKAHALNNQAHFIEIGVWRGGSAAVVARKLQLVNAHVNLYLADTFTGVVKASSKDAFYGGGEHADTSQEIVENLICGIYKNYKILKGIFPDDTSHLIDAENRFCYCHIDVDVYESAKDIVNWIWDKMVTGGMIIFDDYGFHTCSGITRYVNEQKELQDRLIIHNLNGHAIMIKIK
jgi:hypothetical protein